MELLNQGPYYIKLIVDNLDYKDIEEFQNNDIIFKTLINQDKAYILIRFEIVLYYMKLFLIQLSIRIKTIQKIILNLVI